MLIVLEFKLSHIIVNNSVATRTGNFELHEEEAVVDEDEDND